MSSDEGYYSKKQLREIVLWSPTQIDREEKVADAARNNNLAAVKAMLRRGFPVTALSQHGAMPLHWAALHSNADMMEEVFLRYNPPIEAQDANSMGPRWAG